MNKSSNLYPDGFDLEMVESDESDGWNPKYKYKCPCGKGFLFLTISKYDSDNFHQFDCIPCRSDYEILWGKGVITGGSPMVRKK